MVFLKKDALYNRSFLMVDAADHITGKSSATVTVTLSKNGGAFSGAAGSVSEISSGLYNIALTNADTNTLGDLAFHCTASGADPTDFVDQVIGSDLNILVVTAGTNADKTGYTVSTVQDKTGYTVSTVQDKGGYSLVGGVNVTQWTGSTTAVNVAGIPKVDIVDIGGVALSTSTAQLGVNVVNYGGGAVPSTNITGVPKIDLIYANGTTLNPPIAHRLDVNTQALANGLLAVKKNTALANFMFLMLDSTDHVTPKTGLTITSQVSIDGAAFASTANSASELSNGIYTINLAAADLNGTTIMLRFSSAGADDRLIEIVTQA